MQITITIPNEYVTYLTDMVGDAATLKTHLLKHIKDYIIQRKRKEWSEEAETTYDDSISQIEVDAEELSVTLDS